MIRWEGGLILGVGRGGIWEEGEGGFDLRNYISSGVSWDRCFGFGMDLVMGYDGVTDAFIGRAVILVLGS